MFVSFIYLSRRMYGNIGNKIIRRQMYWNNEERLQRYCQLLRIWTKRWSSFNWSQTIDDKSWFSHLNLILLPKLFLFQQTETIKHLFDMNINSYQRRFPLKMNPFTIEIIAKIKAFTGAYKCSYLLMKRTIIFNNKHSNEVKSWSIRCLNTQTLLSILIKTMFTLFYAILNQM